MRAVSEPAVVVQGLWVTGGRVGGYLKRAALRMVAREGEGLQRELKLHFSAKIKAACVRAAAQAALQL